MLWGRMPNHLLVLSGMTRVIELRECPSDILQVIARSLPVRRDTSSEEFPGSKEPVYQ